MKGFWMKFTDGSEAYCEGYSEADAVRIAEKLAEKVVDKNVEVLSLPYPANPIIWQFEHPLSGKCPAFCHSPRECKGRSSCPKSYACTE